jgi:serine protease inhibitor
VTHVRLALLSIAWLAASGSTAAQESSGALVDANTRFAFKFFQQSVARKQDQNVFVAPTALSLDFALLQNGASPAAKADILDAFNLRNLSPEQINHQSEMLRRALAYVQPQLPKGTKRAPDTETGERLIMARSLWSGHGLFKPAFVETARQFYDVTPTTLPANQKAAVDAINSWASQQTGHNLHVLDSVKDDFLLVSTTWFKGIWSSPFSPQNTHPGDFTLLPKQKKSVPMMSDGRRFSYLERPEFQAVRLDYWHAAMFVFLPAESSSLGAFERSLSPDNWAEWISSMGWRPGYLELPRFKFDYRADIRGMLQQMGLESLFTSSGSLAPAVSNPEGANLTRVLQQVSLNVDEKGTEIVSVGAIGGVLGGVHGTLKPEEPFRMIVNRPFFFAILDKETNAILYMGAVVEP